MGTVHLCRAYLAPVPDEKQTSPFEPVSSSFHEIPLRAAVLVQLERMRITGMYERPLQSVTLVFVVLALLVSPGKASTGVCTNESVRAGLHSAGLPDCRAYELVSPVVKYGWPMFVPHVSSSGNRVVGNSLGGLPGSSQTSLLNFYEFVRESLGWTTLPLNAPAGYVNGPGGSGLPAASPDLNGGLFEYMQPGAVDPRDTGFYVQGLPDGAPREAGPRLSRRALESTAPSERLNSSAPSTSSDLSHILFMLNGPEHAHGSLVEYIWPGDNTALRPIGAGWTSLYEYVGTGNSAPSLVGVDSSGHLIGQCGTTLGYPAGSDFTSFQAAEVYNAVSSPDGSKVFFTVAGGPCEEGGIGPSTTELFSSVEESPGTRRVVAISEPTTGPEGDCADCNTSSPQVATFQGASEDGSKVFFLSEQHLLEGAEGLNLYEFDFDAEKGRRVVLVAPDVLGVSRVAEDGSHVYFVDQRVLTSTAADPAGDSAKSGADNLYVYDTKTAGTSFVGGLSEGDTADWQVTDERPVDASPDGRFLVFASSSDLTHEGASGVSQVFEYDAQAKTLVRVSQVQGGAGGTFPATMVFPSYAGHFDPSPQPSSVSDDGVVVVFQSEAALTLHAILGHNNVYEYREGRVSLISDGQDRSVKDGGFPSVSLVGVDGSGRDIFFTTADQLVPQDGDTQEDVYDARIDGGFLPVAPPACESEACQGSLAPLLSPALAGSLGQAAGEQVIEPAVTSKKATKIRAKHKAKKAKHGRRATKARHRAGKPSKARRHR